MRRIKTSLHAVLIAGVTLSAAPAWAFAGGLPTLPGFDAPVAHDVRHSDAFATGLRDAIASGDGRRVTPLFPAGGPAWAWLGMRWADMRRGTLDPRTWEVAFDPYYARADQLGGQLTITAREASGRVVSGRFEVEAWKRGRAWVVGDPLPLERPDARIDRHDLRVDLRKPHRVIAEDLVTITPTGPDRRLFLRLDPALRVAAAVHAGKALPFRQRHDVVYLELPASEHPFQVSLTYEGAPPEAGPDHVRPDSALLRASWAWYPRLIGEAGFAVHRTMVMVPAGRLAVAAGDFVGVDQYEDGQIIAFYAGRYGAYPHRKLAVLESGLGVPYGLGGTFSLPSGAFEQPAMADAVLAHEIAHGWTDRLAYKGTAGERAFMAEGVAAYLDMLYHGDRDGLPAYRALLAGAQKRYGALAARGGDVALAKAVPGADRELWQTLMYDKGAVVFNMLRRRIGGPAFDKGLRELYEGQSGKTVGLADFRAAFDRASGKHQGAFFDQWLGRVGRPGIVPEDLSVRALSGGRFEVRGRLVQAGTPWHVAVPLVVRADKGPRIYEVEVRGAETPFALVVPYKPTTLLVDPLRDTLVAPTADVLLIP